MRIGINLTLDSTAEAAIRHLWQSLALSLPMPQLQARTRYPPHITLTVYDVDDVVPYADTMQRLVSRFRPLPLKLDMLGVFPVDNVLFLAPRMTSTLMSIHRQISETFEDQPVAVYLLPNQWQPHCTLVGGLSQEEIIEAINLCQANWNPVEATGVGIGIRVIPETTNRWHGVLGQLP